MKKDRIEELEKKNKYQIYQDKFELKLELSIGDALMMVKQVLKAVNPK